MTVAEKTVAAFDWKPQPQAEMVVRGLVDRFVAECAAADELARRMTQETGTRFYDWVDHVAVPMNERLRKELSKAGFTESETADDNLAFRHEGAMFPAVVLGDFPQTEVVLKVESVADFAAVHQVREQIDGPPFGLYRHLAVYRDADYRLSVVERHGYRGFSALEAAKEFSAEQAIARIVHLEDFRARCREYEDDAEGFEHAEERIEEAIEELGVDSTCDLFFAAEREFWMRRNTAARVQYARQQRLGLGWGNHDHHTYRSSRKFFTRLVAMWETLGLVCRERFYAGREAGWGAQVMESAAAGIVTFNDVDLSPEELMEDFAHQPLAERKELGTIGLWCGLHGESFLQAGMHHLEAQFDFESLRRQLESEAGVKTMKPFTDFPHLRQAFTEGERWKVEDGRVRMLLEEGKISEEQAKQFRDNGAIGSHLENLERNAGFKGFNQKGVSEIIAATDPRKHAGK